MKYLHGFAAWFFSLSFSAWLGRVEFHTDDTGIMAGLIGLGGFLAAMVAPKRPWVWGLIVPAGVILVNVWKLNAGHLGSVCGIAAFTIAVASAGAHLGSFVRRQASPA